MYILPAQQYGGVFCALNDLDRCFFAVVFGRFVCRGIGYFLPVDYYYYYSYGVLVPTPTFVSSTGAISL